MAAPACSPRSYDRTLDIFPRRRCKMPWRHLPRSDNTVRRVLPRASFAPSLARGLSSVTEATHARVQGHPRLLVSLATYNEVENLRPLVETIREYAPHSSILIIDDHSPDGT